MLYRNITDQILHGVKPLGVINIPDEQEDFWIMMVWWTKVHTFAPLSWTPITSVSQIQLPVDTEKMKDILMQIGIPIEHSHAEYLIQQWIDYSVTQDIPYLVDIPPSGNDEIWNPLALPDNSLPDES